jgi:hypothetical protein
MSSNEVDLNNPLNWYVADSMGDYDTRVDPETAKIIMHRHNAYPKLVQAVQDAVSILENTGHNDEADRLKRELKELGEQV